MSFIFGGDTNLTYDQIQRRRQIAESMAPRGTSQNAAEGISNAARMISGALINRKADRAEERGRSAADEVFASLVGGQSTPYSAQPAAFSPQPVTTPSVTSGPIPDTPEAVGADARAAIGAAPTGPDDIRAGLISRGLPEHVADGFIMNFQDESGMDPGINEIAPLVPGSRGGFGLYQLTGPRRREYEAFAASQGLPVDSVDAQLDFLVQELQGSESRAAESIMSTRTAGEAGAAIVNDFLRPSREHRESRANRYLGGSQSPQAGRGGNAPQQGTGPTVQALMAAMSDPFMRPEQKAVISSLLGQQMQANDPLRQLQIQQAQVNLDNSRSGTADMPSGVAELQWRAQAAGLQPGTPEYQAFVLNGGGDPATFRALDMQAQAAGLQPGTPEYAEFMATRGAGNQAYAKTTATNLAETETGGAAAEVVAEGAATGKANAEQASELSEMQRNISGLEEVVEQLDALSETATYTWAGRARDEAMRQAGREPTESAIARTEYIAVVDNQILPLLRQTFGAAFTAKEGETLRNTLGDANKSPSEKQAVLRAFIAQQRRNLESRGGVVPEQPTPPAQPTTGLSDEDLQYLGISE